MGSVLSTPKRSGVQKSREPEDEDDGDPRPAKRRRLAQVDSEGISSQHQHESPVRRPFGQVTASKRIPLRSKPQPVKPSDFYGSAAFKDDDTTPNLDRGSIGHLLAKEPIDFKESLQVEILEISPTFRTRSDSLRVDSTRGSTIDIKCKCSVAIFCAWNDDDPGNIQPRDYVEMCRLVQDGTLRVAVHQDGQITREVLLPEPFIFKPKEFRVRRKTRKPNGQFFYEDGFPDKYNVHVFLAPRGSRDEENWPPFEVPAAATEVINGKDDMPISRALLQGRITEGDLRLFCKTNALFEPARQGKPAFLSVTDHTYNTKQIVSYTLSLNITWALPSHFSTVVVKRQKVEPVSNSLLSVSPPDHPVTPRESRVQGLQVEPPAVESPSDSRAQRRRGNISTYNLKALSDQQLGKVNSPKTPKKREPRSKSENHALVGENLSVTYSFGRADAADAGVRQITTVASLNCPLCNCNNRSVDDLRLHLHTEHTFLKFSLRGSHVPRISFFVEWVKSRSSPEMTIERSRTFQMGKPMTLFDFEKFMKGDESWSKARQGPQHNTWPEHLQREIDSSMSSSPHGSRYSSPNTSNGPDDFLDFEKPQTFHIPARPKKKFIVPETYKPLYDPLTKQRLRPGDEVPDSDEEKDEFWLDHKQKALINDFTDVNDVEKDYINRWNPFITSFHLTNALYLPEAMMAFCEISKWWFAEDMNRRTEWFKHMEVFILRGNMNNKHLHKCIGILCSVEDQYKVKQKDREKEDENEVSFKVEKPPELSVSASVPAKQRPPLVCECEKMTVIPDSVTCRGLTCKVRWYHKACAKKQGRSIIGEWKCDACVPWTKNSTSA